MSESVDDLKAVKVGSHLREVINDRGNAEESRTATEVLLNKSRFLLQNNAIGVSSLRSLSAQTDLQMPEEECEDESHPDAHDPGDAVEDQHAQVGHGLEDGHELGHRPQLLREHLGLLAHLLQLLALPSLLLTFLE